MKEGESVSGTGCENRTLSLQRQDQEEKGCEWLATFLMHTHSV